MQSIRKLTIAVLLFLLAGTSCSPIFELIVVNQAGTSVVVRNIHMYGLTDLDKMPIPEERKKEILKMSTMDVKKSSGGFQKVAIECGNAEEVKIDNKINLKPFFGVFSIYVGAQRSFYQFPIPGMYELSRKLSSGLTFRVILGKDGKVYLVDKKLKKIEGIEGFPLEAVPQERLQLKDDFETSGPQ